ncbi:hypothetical protein K8F61_17120 [Microbacterium resistens]|uniref:Head-to-tail stopper n=1 Tax=Microbacterium resistens TaxID=156977 RepID=A0ABY3RTS7_9MICO|nr:hypothetical protein [Microbacterium resistens]UGS26326.1 hypothetical protein K8F61_17120 [Microbacterium resistens]
MISGVVARHSITIVRAPLVEDGRGNEARDWEHAAESASAGWAIDVGASGEDTVNRDGSSVAYTLRGPFAADVQATDRVRLFGDLYDVDGGVLRQPGPSPVTSHTIIRLIRWEG